MIVFAVMTISVHLPVLVPIEEAWIYGAIALSTFVGLHLPHEDLDDANSTVDDEIEDSPSSFLLSFIIVMCLFTMSMMNVHLQILVPNIVESNIYRFIALSTFIGLRFPNEDLNDANTTVHEEIEESACRNYEVDHFPTTSNSKRRFVKAKQTCRSSKVLAQRPCHSFEVIGSMSHHEEMESVRPRTKRSRISQVEIRKRRSLKAKRTCRISKVLLSDLVAASRSLVL
jgi:hypothetical protein